MAQSKEKTQVSQTIVGGLGRPFTLGMLYNAPKDALVPGIALWDSQTLQSLTAARPQRSSHFNISASDSTSETSFNLNVDASLKLSFMSGTIEVGGSANYLNNKKEFKNQCRVTLQYQATTHFEQLCLTPDVLEKIQSSKISDKGLATHVVTGIEYGANAFFVFNSQKEEASNVQTIKGDMEVVIKKIPQFDVEGKAEIELTDEEQNFVKTFSVQFYGDFLLETNPATFDAAVQTYVDLPKLLMGADGKEPVNTVPVRVWLLPLEVLTLQPGPVTKGISVGLVIEAENFLEDLSNVKLRCNDCLSVSAVGKFPQLHDQLHTFNKLCHYYTVELQRQMAEICPAIREGTKQESDLRRLFEDRDKSPFSQDKLTQWLQDKEREINVVQSNLNIMEGLPVLSTQAEVDKFVLAAPDNRWVYGYIFIALGDSDQQLDDMSQYLSAIKMGRPYEPSEADAQTVQAAVKWYYNDRTVKYLRQMAFTFKSAKDVILFVAAISDAQFEGMALYLYDNGILVDRSQPTPESLTEKLSGENSTPERQ